MGRVQIKISPSLLAMTSFRKKGDWLALPREINGNTTIGGMLRSLTEEYEEFTPMIFDNAGNITDDINVVLNDTMLLTSEAHKISLKDSDVIILLPVYTGG